MQCPFCQHNGAFRDTRTRIANGRVWVCVQCGGYFLHPPHPVQYQESTWSEMRARLWDSTVARGNVHASRIATWYKERTGQRLRTVLEIGCGSAFMGPGFQDLGVQYTGVDVDLNSVSRAAEKGISAHCVSAERLRDHPLGQMRYDLVLSSNALEHVADPMAAFHSLRACVGGIAVVIVPNAEGLLPRAKSNPIISKAVQKFLGTRREIAYTIDGYWHNIAFSMRTLAYLAEKASLNVQELRTIGINDEVFGFVQPNESWIYRSLELGLNLLNMQSQLMLVAD